MGVSLLRRLVKKVCVNIWIWLIINMDWYKIKLIKIKEILRNNVNILKNS